MKYIIKMVFKGLLLYITTIAVAFFIGGIDSLYENGYLFSAMLVVAVMIYTSYKILKKEDVDILTFKKYIQPEEEDDDEEDEW